MFRLFSSIPTVPSPGYSHKNKIFGFVNLLESEIKWSDHLNPVHYTKYNAKGPLINNVKLRMEGGWGWGRGFP